jgi:competence protein ComEA
MQHWLDRNRFLVLGLALLMLAAGLGAERLTRAESPQPLSFRSDSVLPDGSPIRVQVIGAVARPGVYDLHQGDRVTDAIAAAGGAATDADLSQLNLALKVRDEQQLTVPKKSGAAALVPTLAPGTKLDINMATQAQLDALPGIGEAYSRRIVDSRLLDGPYKTTQDLVARKVLPKAIFDQISALISIGP